MVVAGFEPGKFGLRNSRLTTELLKPTTTTYVTKYVFIFKMASRTIRPSTCAIPQFQFWLKKTLSNALKVVNVSKSQYYEIRHNIMNLGSQNSKYSWRIRDLENPQTGTQFANSVLMYKMMQIGMLCCTVYFQISTFPLNNNWNLHQIAFLFSLVHNELPLK